jgi:hypothetical protein
MTAELTRRPDGAARHPWDWYVEEHWVTQVLIERLSLEPHVRYWDPCCGQGHILQVLQSANLMAFGTDKFERTPPDFPAWCGEHDILGDQHHLLEAAPALSIISNPPFSYQDGRMVTGLAEAIVRRALTLATHKVMMLLPLKWLASIRRYGLFSDQPPSVYVLCERPSMPPGDQIAALGNRAWSRGKVDYMWLVWDKKAPFTLPFAPTFWIPPRAKGLNGETQ